MPGFSRYVWYIFISLGATEQPRDTGSTLIYVLQKAQLREVNGLGRGCTAGPVWVPSLCPQPLHDTIPTTCCQGSSSDLGGGMSSFGNFISDSILLFGPPSPRLWKRLCLCSSEMLPVCTSPAGSPCLLRYPQHAAYLCSVTIQMDRAPMTKKGFLFRRLESSLEHGRPLVPPSYQK